MKKYAHSVIGVSSDLAAIAIGTLGREDVEEYEQLRDWLAWRLDEGWSEPIIQRVAAYENAVRAMAREALAMFDADESVVFPKKDVLP